MQSIDLLRHNLRESETLVLARIEDMREHAVVFPTSNGGCHTLRALGHLADLDTPSATVPKGFEDTFGTCRLCLQYAADHWYMHRGQLADARRAAGVARMWM